jgi:hypothetical protein
MTDVKESVRDTLINDSDYLVLMGSPDGDSKNTFYFRPPERPTFPETVIVFQPEQINQEFGEHLIVGTTPCIINIWSRDDAYEQIAERVIELLHHSTGMAEGIKVVMIEEPQEIYDQKFNTYGKSLSFAIFYRRSTE